MIVRLGLIEQKAVWQYQNNDKQTDGLKKSSVCLFFP